MGGTFGDKSKKTPRSGGCGKEKRKGKSEEGGMTTKDNNRLLYKKQKI